MLKEMRVSRQAWRKVLPPLEKHSLMEIHTENDSGCVQAHCRSQLLFLHQRVPGALRSLEMQKRKKEESSSSLPRSLLLLGERWEVVRRVGVSCAAFYKATGCPETSLHLEPPAQPQAAPGRAGSLPGAEARRGLRLWLCSPQHQKAGEPKEPLSECPNPTTAHSSHCYGASPPGPPNAAVKAPPALPGLTLPLSATASPEHPHPTSTWGRSQVGSIVLVPFIPSPWPPPCVLPSGEASTPGCCQLPPWAFLLRFMHPHCPLQPILLPEQRNPPALLSSPLCKHKSFFPRAVDYSTTHTLT